MKRVLIGRDLLGDPPMLAEVIGRAIAEASPEPILVGLIDDSLDSLGVLYLADDVDEREEP